MIKDEILEKAYEHCVQQHYEAVLQSQNVADDNACACARGSGNKLEEAVARLEDMQALEKQDG